VLPARGPLRARAHIEAAVAAAVAVAVARLVRRLRACARRRCTPPHSAPCGVHVPHEPHARVAALSAVSPQARQAPLAAEDARGRGGHAAEVVVLQVVAAAVREQQVRVAPGVPRQLLQARAAREGVDLQVSRGQRTNTEEQSTWRGCKHIGPFWGRTAQPSRILALTMSIQDDG